MMCLIVMCFRREFRDSFWAVLLRCSEHLFHVLVCQIGGDRKTGELGGPVEISDWASDEKGSGDLIAGFVKYASMREGIANRTNVIELRASW